MENIPDEELMAFADGALSRVEHARVEALLACDPHLKDRLQPFVVSRAVLAEAFSGAVHAPIPDRLIKAITAGAKAPVAARAHKTESGAFSRLLESVSSVLFPSGPQFAHAFSLTALVAGSAALGWVAAHQSVTTGGSSHVASLDGAIIADPLLTRVLESAPGSAPGSATANGSIIPVLTFQAQDGKFCREYEMTGQTGKHFAGFACRQATGAWHVVFHAESKAAAKGFETAAGGSPALEAAIEKFSDGGRVEAADEAALIAKAWKAQP